MSRASFETSLGIMETIVARHKHMKEVYDYAVAHYESHWASPIATC